MPDPVNVDEYEQLAKEILEEGEYDFIAGGATDEITVGRTRKVLDSILIRPRMSIDVSRTLR